MWQSIRTVSWSASSRDLGLGFRDPVTEIVQSKESTLVTTSFRVTA